MSHDALLFYGKKHGENRTSGDRGAKEQVESSALRSLVAESGSDRNHPVGHDQGVQDLKVIASTLQQCINEFIQEFRWVLTLLQAQQTPPLPLPQPSPVPNVVEDPENVGDFPPILAQRHQRPGFGCDGCRRQACHRPLLNPPHRPHLPLSGSNTEIEEAFDPLHHLHRGLNQ
ncbi:hypothetical protein Scep_017397 [Stephania cephalantha]|uniref:Uncharacterized protein n=1 Tax=Stephania cephalantha TaxID=152367 RepID=A0AAP0NUY5_9MAGN